MWEPTKPFAPVRRTRRVMMGMVGIDLMVFDELIGLVLLVLWLLSCCSVDVEMGLENENQQLTLLPA
jgi:hypothetical protein